MNAITFSKWNKFVHRDYFFIYFYVFIKICTDIRNLIPKINPYGIVLYFSLPKVYYKFYASAPAFADIFADHFYTPLWNRAASRYLQAFRIPRVSLHSHVHETREGGTCFRQRIPGFLPRATGIGICLWNVKRRDETGRVGGMRVASAGKRGWTANSVKVSRERNRFLCLWWFYVGFRGMKVERERRKFSSCRDVRILLGL